MKRLLFFFSLIFFLMTSCKPEEPVPSIDDYSYLKVQNNLLDYHITPSEKFDKKGLMFSDQGAWFGYSFQKESSEPIGFSGPFIMTQQNGVWLTSSLSSFKILNADNSTISFHKESSHSYLSHLEQRFTSNNLSIKQELVYKNGHTALIRTQIKNTSESSIRLKIEWANSTILSDGIQLAPIENGIKITSSKSEATGYLKFPEETQIQLVDSLHYVSSLDLNINSNATESFIISQSFIFPEYAKTQSDNNIQDFDTILKKRQQEKNTQLKELIENTKPKFKDSIYSMVIAKSLLTLQNNWRIPAGEIAYDGLFPSYHYKWFNGFWSWDSWKHAVALSYYDTELAKRQIQLMFEFQNEDGFIADCVYRDTSIEAHNYRNTKPPLSTWAVINVFERSNDTAFIKHMYPKLKTYHYWWYKKRDHDQDGLCEYGSTDGSIIAAKWESGMDNAIRFDNSVILKNAEDAYSLDQESVDLNAYLFAEKQYLMKLGELIGKAEDVDQYQKEAEALKSKIQQQFYSEEDGWFYDTSIDGKTFIKGEGCEGWIPLWAKVATKDQAESVKHRMMNPEAFFTKVPFQTMSADHEKFDPLQGYWRGPNWFDQAYFGVKGLRHYGYNTEADKATIKLLEGAEGLLDKGPSIRENYHPLTGKGLHAHNFSWSAAHVIMLLGED